MLYHVTVEPTDPYLHMECTVGNAASLEEAKSMIADHMEEQIRDAFAAEAYYEPMYTEYMVTKMSLGLARDGRVCEVVHTESLTTGVSVFYAGKLFEDCANDSHFNLYYPMSHGEYIQQQYDLGKKC